MLVRNLGVALMTIGTLALSFDVFPQGMLRELPPILRTISDEVGVLSTSEGQALAKAISDVERETSVEIIVIIAETTAPETMDAYLQRLSAHWRTHRPSASAAEDMRVFVAIAVADRTLRIASGARLASVVAQVTKGPVMTELLPMFRSGEYSRALSLIVQALSEAIGFRRSPAV